MSSESVEQFLGAVESFAPTMNIESRTKLGSMFMHYITLSRVYNQVNLEKVLDRRGLPFIDKIIRNKNLVRNFAFEVKLDMRVPWKEQQVPEWLATKAKALNINVEAYKSRRGDTCNEIWLLIKFVEAARKVMQAVHEDTLRSLDRGYRNHCHPNFKPKSGHWYDLRGNKNTCDSKCGLAAYELPGARTTGVKVKTLKPAPVLVARNRSESSESSQSTSSSGSSSSSRKSGPQSSYSRAHPAGPRAAPQLPAVYNRPRLDRPAYQNSVPFPVHAVYYAQCTALSAYQQAMWEASKGSQRAL